MNGTTDVLKIAPGKINGVKQEILLEGIIQALENTRRI